MGDRLLKQQRSRKLARARSHKLAKLKGFHQCCEKCLRHRDGSETHVEQVDLKGFITFKLGKPPGYSKSDPELWELERKENLELARQREYNNYGISLVAKDVTRLEKLRNAFETFDVNGDGCLDKSELLAVLTRAGGGSSMKEEDALEFLELFDANNDGAMQYTEFVEAMKALAVSSGVFKGDDQGAEEAAEAIVEGMGISMVDRSQWAELSKANQEAAAGADTAEGVAASAEPLINSQLRELLEGLDLSDHLSEAVDFCRECEIESISELKAAECEGALVDTLELKPAKTKLLLERIAEMEEPDES